MKIYSRRKYEGMSAKALRVPDWHEFQERLNEKKEKDDLRKYLEK